MSILDKKPTNEKKTYNYIDSGNVPHSIEFGSDDFKLVQVDKSIHDTKFKSKPTTFFKDALKRFSKNKASVVGACILGTLLLCSIIVPLADTNDIYTSRGNEQFLPAKLFPFGTGFWDGSKKYEDVVADPSFVDDNGKMYPGTFESQGSIVSFDKNYISNLSKPVKRKTNLPSLYGEGGTFLFKGNKIVNNTQGAMSDEELLEQLTYQYYSPEANLDLSKNYVINVDVNDDFNYEAAKRGKTSYSLSLAYGEKEKKDSALRSTPLLPLTEYVEGDLSVNINEILLALPEKPVKEEEILPDVLYRPTAAELSNASIVFSVRPSYEHDTVLPITTVKTNEDDKLFKSYSITNPCFTLATKAQTHADSYWSLVTSGDVGSVAVDNATCYFVSFTYDSYGAVYGLTPNVRYGQETLRKYTEKGKLPADLFDLDAIDTEKYIGIDLYNEKIDGKLYDDTPIRYIDEYKFNSIWNEEKGEFETIYEVSCRVQKYKQMGYDSEPIFIFGTDKQGHDIFKKAFVGLRQSLLIGICAAAVCFLFGLCYGAVEGYFGGTVDIVMQRFTDILSGVPWIVIMTLMIIKFGNTPLVFGAALCLTGWIGIAGLTRTQFYRFRGREYILASRTLGANDSRLIFRHILPNAMGTIITSSVLMIPSIVFQEATISYLGLGLKGQKYVSLGVLLSNNQQYLQTYPNLLIVPATIIALLMISFNLFGNGLRDAFNPSLKGSE